MDGRTQSVGAAVAMAAGGGLGLFTAAVQASGGLAIVLGVGGGLATVGAIFVLIAGVRN